MSAGQWAPSAPHDSNWQPKSAAAYSSLHQKNPSTSISEQILHITEEERKSLAATIEAELDRRLPNPTGGLGSDSQKSELNNVIRALLGHPQHGEMLSWAGQQGEEDRHVKQALYIVVSKVHNSRIKRARYQAKKAPSLNPDPQNKLQSKDQDSKEQDSKEQDSKAEPFVTLPDTRVRVPRRHSYLLLFMGYEESYRIDFSISNPISIERVLDTAAEGYQANTGITGVGFKILYFDEYAGGIPTHLRTSEQLRNVIYSDIEALDKPLSLTARLDEATLQFPDRRSLSFRPPSKERIFKSIEPPGSDFSLPRSYESSASEEQFQPPSKRISERRRVLQKRQRARDSDAEDDDLPPPKRRNTENTKAGGSSAKHAPRARRVQSPSTGGIGPWSPPVTPALTANTIQNPTTGDEVNQNLIETAEHRVRPLQLPSWDELQMDCQVGNQVPDMSYDDLNVMKLNETTNQPPDNTDDILAAANVDEHQEEETEEEKFARESLEISYHARKLIEHRDPEMEARMHSLFRSDPSQKSAKDMISLEGLLRPLMPHQAYAATYILWSETHSVVKDEKPIGFMYLTDEPGYGKSATVAAILVIQRWLEIARNDVKDSRKKDDGKHLREDEADHHRPCPSQQQYGICCPCVKSNPSADMPAPRGLNLMMVPTELVVNTIKEWYQQVDMSHPRLRMRLAVQTTARGPRDNKIVAGPKGNEQTYTLSNMCLTQEEINDLIKQTNAGQEPSKLGRVPTGLRRYVILTAPHSIEGYISKRKLDTLPYGRLIRDEVHMEPGISTKGMQLFRELVWSRVDWSDGMAPRTTWLSGTPIDGGIKALEGVMSVVLLAPALKGVEIEVPAELPKIQNSQKSVAFWKVFWSSVKSPFWKLYTPTGLQAIQRDWGSRKTEVAEAAKQAWVKLLPVFQIGRGRGSLWNGEPIMEVPRMMYKLVEVTIDQPSIKQVARAFTDPNLQLQGKDINEQMKVLIGSSSWSKKKKCASFPRFASLFQQNLIELSSDEVQRNKWVGLKKFDDTNPYFKHRAKLFQSSPKIPMINEILSHHLQQKDYLDRPAKGILFVENVETALVLHVYLEKVFFPTFNLSGSSTVFHSGLNKADREKAVDDFQNGDHCTVLIGVARVCGTGLTLTRSTFVILCEQMSSQATWKQMIARQVRKGNWNWKGVLVYEIFVKNYTEDRCTKAMREKRQNVLRETQEQLLAELKEAQEELAGEKKPDEDDESDGAMVH